MGKMRGKVGLIKHDVAGYYNFVSGEIETTVAMVIGWVTEEETFCGSKTEFMGSGEGEIRVGQTTENSKVSMWMGGGKRVLREV